MIIFRKWILWIFISLPFSCIGQALIDEHFDDWDSLKPSFIDTRGEVSTNRVDFDRFWITNDNEYLFIRFNFLNREINLQSDNDLILYIDIDNNSSTGLLVNGIGAEIEFRFGDKFGIARLPNLTTNIEQNDIGLISLPTVTGRDFELGIKRDFNINGQSVQINNSIRFVLKDGSAGDQIPNNGEFINYTIDSNIIGLSATYQINKKDVSHLRILSLNTLFDQSFEFSARSSTERVMKSIDPDIIALQEVRETSASEASDYMDQWLPLEGSNKWFSEKIEPDIIVCSKEPILRSSPIDGNGAFFLQYGSRNILLINTHLPCCDNESGRQAEVDNIMSFIRDSKNGISDIPLKIGTPIIILGDMNLVGNRQQRKTLLDGNIINENTYGRDFEPDWDGSDFIMSDMPTTNTPFSYTWKRSFSDFWPGRLDYIIYSGSAMKQENGYALDTREMSSNELINAGLFSSDSDNISDHLACVADFNLDLATDTRNFTDDELIVYPYQNHDRLIAKIELDNRQKLDILITDPLGQVLTKRSEIFNTGKNNFSINISGIPSGVYYLRISNNKKIKTTPIFIYN